MSDLTQKEIALAVERIMTRCKPDNNGCLVWTGATRHGYGAIRVCGKTYQVHRIMHLAFNGGPGDLCVCHACDNRACVNPRHLWLGTYADNNRDMAEKGRNVLPLLKGEDCPWAKLNAEKVLAIRNRYVPYSRTHGQHALAREFGVGRSYVALIINRDNWKHI